MKLGASTLTFRRVSLAGAVDRLQRLGFDTVDLACIFPSYCPHFDPTAWPRNAADLETTMGKLQVATLQAAMASWNSNDRIVRAAQLELITGALNVADAVGAYAVTIQSGNKPRVGSDWTATAQFVSESIRMAARRAELLGLHLSLELRAGSLTETVEQAEKLLELIASPAAGVAVDTGSVAAAGMDAAAVIERLGSRVQHIHLRDGKPGQPMLTPGDGLVDFAAVGRALQKIGYTRVCSLALDWNQPPASPSDELRRARAHLGETFDTAS